MTDDAKPYSGGILGHLPHLKLVDADTRAPQLPGTSIYAQEPTPVGEYWRQMFDPEELARIAAEYATVPAPDAPAESTGAKLAPEATPDSAAPETESTVAPTAFAEPPDGDAA